MIAIQPSRSLLARLAPVLLVVAAGACSTNTKPVDRATRNAPVARPTIRVEESSGSLYRGGTAEPASASGAAETRGPADILSQRDAADASPAQAAGLSYQIPNDWNAAAAGGMRAAQYSLPGPDGAGELILYFFGSGQGGDAQANLDRWIGQVAQPDGSDSRSKAHASSLSVGPLTVHAVMVDGTYTASMPGSSEKTSVPHQRLWAAVLEGEGGPWFWKAVGPTATIERHQARLEALLRSCAPAAAAAAMKSSESGSAVPATKSTESATAGSSQTVAGLSFAPSSRWEVRAVKGMRAAEYGLPSPAGDPGDLVLYFFGEGQGGDTKANLDRWVHQMEQPDGSSSDAKAKSGTRKVGELTVTTVEVDGTYTASMMPGSEVTERKPNFRLWGAVIEGPGGPWFWKAVGPRSAIEANAAELEALLRSLRRGS